MRRRVRRGTALALATALGSGVAFAADPVPLGPEIVVSDGLPYGDMDYPDVARGADGGFVVVWDTEYDGKVMARTFDATGSPTSSHVEVSAASVFERNRYPFVDSDAAGNFVVVWDGYFGPPGYPGYHGLAQRLDATGTPLGPTFEVTGTGTPFYHYNFTSNVAVGDHGEFVIAWDNIDPYYGSGRPEISAQRFDADGNFVGGKIAVASDPSSYFHHPTIGIDADDDFVIAWTQQYGTPDSVYLQRFDAAGTPAGPVVPVNANHLDYASNPWRLTPVAMNASGAFVVGWLDYDTLALNVQRYDAGGAAVGTPLEVAPLASYALDIALEDDGDFVVVWVDDAIMGRRFDALADSLGAAFQVSDGTGFNRYSKANVASTTDDAFVVVWSENDVYARRFGIPKATGITAAKLVIVDKVAIDGRAKVVFVARNDAGIAKGPAGAGSALSGTFDVFYADDSSVAGSFVFPSPWQRNDTTLAKFVNTLAPGGPTQVKLAVVKTGLVAKVRTKGLGDGPAIDLFAGPPSASGGITSVLTLVNAGLERRFCTRFAVDDGSQVTLSEIGGGLGRKLVATGGVPAACP